MWKLAFRISIRAIQIINYKREGEQGKPKILHVSWQGKSYQQRRINETCIRCSSCNVLHVSRKRYFNTQLNSVSYICRHFQISNNFENMPPTNIFIRIKDVRRYQSGNDTTYRAQLNGKFKIKYIKINRFCLY